MFPDAMFNFNNGLILLICGLFSLIVPFGWAQQRSNKPDEFSCPEEFGYYPHPTDCTQYYVCVFGGALLESCTGGLMYSHDLQTCDWPRNVGCVSSTSSNDANSVNTAPGNEELAFRQTTPSWKHEALQPQQQDEIPDRHLYEEEDLRPIEEVESDRQQRVYRGQPPTLGVVARDRDGLVRHLNALQTSAGPEKVKPVAVLSFNPHHQSLREANTTRVGLLLNATENTHNLNGHFETNRVRRQVTSRTESETNNTRLDGTVHKGGYALRFRPLDAASSDAHDVVSANSSENTDDLFNQFLIKINVSRPIESSSSPQLQVLFSTTSKPFEHADSFLNPSHGSVPYASSSNRNKYTYFSHINPTGSGSAQMNRYTKVEETPYVATDFSIVNVVPKAQQPQPSFPSRHHYSTPYEQQASNHHHRPQIYPHPNPGAISTNNFYSPHHFDRQHLNPYYGPVGPPPLPPLPPRFYPAINPYTNNNYLPETSIVTLTYPKPETSPQAVEHSSSDSESSSPSSIHLQSTDSSSTTTTTTTTVKPTEQSPNTTHDASESTKNVKKKKKKKTSDDELFGTDDEEYEKDDDERMPDENEDEDHTNEEFSNDELNVPSASHLNETNVVKVPGDGESNEEETATDQEESEDQPVEHEHEEEDEEPSTTEHEAEIDEGVPEINDNMESELEMMFDGDDEVGKMKYEDDHSDKPEPSESSHPPPPADSTPQPSKNVTSQVKRTTKFPVSFSSFYRRYLSDEHETSLSDPDFDLSALQSDLVKPVTVLPPPKFRQNTTDFNATANRVKKANYGYYEKIPHTNTYAKVSPAVNHANHAKIPAAKISQTSNYADLPQSTSYAKPPQSTYHAKIPQASDHINVPQASNNSPTNRTSMSRKNDHVLTLQIYDQLPSVLVKSARATSQKPVTASSKRVIPLALLHSYKPANHSYTNRQHRYRLQPTTVYNAYEDGHKSLPVSQYNNIGKTSYFPDYHTFGSYFPSYQYSSPTFNFSNTSINPPVEDEECQGDECNEEEAPIEDTQPEEEDANNTNEGSGPDDNKDSPKENEEYYDDYANDYANDEHLDHPYTGPIVPTEPPQIRNIDYEVTPPHVDFDDKPKENEDENEEQEDPENEAEEEEEEEEDDGKNEQDKGEQQQEDEEDDSEDSPQEDQQEETENEENPDDTPENNESEETSAVLQKLRKPPKAAAAVDQIMTQHRQNKYLKNPTTHTSNHITKKLPSPRGAMITTAPSTTPAPIKSVPKTTSTITSKPDRDKAKAYSNKTKATSAHQTSFSTKSTESPTMQTLSSNNPSSAKWLPYDNKSKRKLVEQERKNTNTETNAKQTRPTKSTSKWPSPPVPTYIVEQASSSVPTTTKAVYNVTKYEPYYSVYDDDAEIYRDIADYSQYQSPRKVPNTYQVIQKPQHRLQPQQSQVLNSVPSYTNQDYRLQSNIDGDSQQSEKSASTRLFLDNSHLEALNKPANENPVKFFVSNPNSQINLPVVSHANAQNNENHHNNNSNRHLRITSFFNLSNDTYQPTNFKPTETPTKRPTFETVKSYELTLIDHDDVVTGETLQLPKVTPYYFIRKFSPNTTTLGTTTTTTTTTTNNFIKSSTKASTTGTTSLRPTTKLKTHNVLINNENFRIIVEPIAVYKKLAATANTFTTPSTTKTTSPFPSFKAFTNALLLGDKFSASAYRSQPSNFTYTPYTTITTTTAKPTTLKLSTSSSSDSSQKPNRRFYIPRTDTNTFERKLQFPSITSTAASLAKVEPSSRSTKKVSSSATSRPQLEYVEDEEDYEVPRNSKAVSSASLSRNRGNANDTIKLYEDNEILYYDDYYDDVDGEKSNDDNYIDNKISEYTTASSSTTNNDFQIQKSSTKPLTKASLPTKTATATATASTAVNVPSKSSFSQKVPFEESTTFAAVSKDAGIGTKRFKESSTQRCPQCNEKPLVRGRNRGSVTYTTGGNEYDSVTSAGGRTRPTLKPSTSIVTKVAEPVDVYKFPPRRPDPIYPTPQVDKAAAKCRKDLCLLPDCSCGGKDIPGDLPVEDVPQLVLLTFDDSVNELNKGLYADLFEKGRVNPNGCPISATFYVSHEWTDYSMVQNLYATGHEIASHSVSHSFGEQFSQRKWTKEIVGQREILSAYGGVRQEDIRGMRAPFLAVGGNKMFKMLYDTNFTYDSSMPIYENRPPSWPYTLDYKLFHDCMIPPCPTRSYPGVWEVPMVMWQDLNGGRCSMGDACSNPLTSDGVYKMLIKNFERHFTTNRAPFGLFYHSSWFTQPHHKEGFLTFLDTIMNMPEVWLVTNWQAIQWARDPTPISRLNQFTPFGCDYPERPKRCNNAKVCNLWHKSGVRYLKTCQPCPEVYPWTGKTGVRNSRVDNDDSLTE